MKVVSIGRRSSNEVVVRDPLVSREQHCLISEDENGRHFIFDANSTNGTYVNGSRIPNAVNIRLHRTDVVRIGNTVLPWQSYFKHGGHPGGAGGSGGSGNHGGDEGYGGYDGGDTLKEPTTIALQAIALVLSLAGLGCVVFVAVKIMSWGIFGLAFNYTTGIIGAGCGLVAIILAEVADYQEETDNTTMAKIAEWIGSACLFTVIAFVIIINVNPDLLNPFVNMFK
ncbi:MAG: FHA domain-containing protein [Paludibacteraceae bacterium]|nr:FHA domain-containing protein [Paludibacteraceae bacterium]